MSWLGLVAFLRKATKIFWRFHMVRTSKNDCKTVFRSIFGCFFDFWWLEPSKTTEKPGKPPKNRVFWKCVKMTIFGVFSKWPGVAGSGRKHELCFKMNSWDVLDTFPWVSHQKRMISLVLISFWNFWFWEACFVGFP